SFLNLITREEAIRIRAVAAATLVKSRRFWMKEKMYTSMVEAEIPKSMEKQSLSSNVNFILRILEKAAPKRMLESMKKAPKNISTRHPARQQLKLIEAPFLSFRSKHAKRVKL
ncbi:MAG: hypothetical protein QXQ63_04840, partial [Candidatus Bathyarchaeia archaeon]